jgi:hypothetical protein
MFNINGFVTTVTEKAAEVKSTTMAEVLQSAAAVGYNLPNYNFVKSTKFKDNEGHGKHWLILAEDFEENGITVPIGKKKLQFSISDKIKFDAPDTDISGKLAELVANNYPVYWGETNLPEEPIVENGITVGMRPASVRKWLTLAPAGSIKAVPAKKADLLALFSGSAPKPEGEKKFQAALATTGVDDPFQP